MNFQTSKTRSHIGSTLGRAALAVALTLSANGAMAATSQVHNTNYPAHAYPAHAVHTRAAAANYGQFAQRPFDVPAFVTATLAGLGVPIVIHATRTASIHGRATSGGDNSQVFETNPAPVEVDNSQSQAAIDATDQAIQQTDQDTFQMDESLNQ
jgi:hypothetical protein